MLEARLSLVVCGRAKEWADYEVAVHEPPTQADRRDFYSQKKGCITLADAKHKRLGWRTGRAYHALFAGTPVVIEADHEGIAQGFAAFTTPQDLRGWDVAWQDEATRAAHWVKQLEAVKKDRAILEATFKAAGL
jgi:hypothetical protein